ncbi:putative Palmitoyltransferase ZDHHC2 [Blattamonas nauphoetae]|uniref:Palmitoyltransferase n=1 Tax=Blattamonas nauphoetae TaxID=2049346 RepID=A0ABQ9XX67_9EUKA|nr:putative Palmitoyltransferase ZDHHC2 [Blattamonas nauphoetae]
MCTCQSCRKASCCDASSICMYITITIIQVGTACLWALIIFPKIHLLNVITSIVLTAFFALSLLYEMSCFNVTVFSDPGSVPEWWKELALPVWQQRAQARILTANMARGAPTLQPTPSTSIQTVDSVEEEQETTLQQFRGDWSNTEGTDAFERITWCEKCQNVRPERAHHCSVCDICVLRMDHHCGFVSNCVGQWNYKSFLLFCISTPIAALFYIAGAVLAAIQVFKIRSDSTKSFFILLPLLFWAFILFILSVFALSMFIDSIRMTQHNLTSIEDHGARLESIEVVKDGKVTKKQIRGAWDEGSGTQNAIWVMGRDWCGRINPFSKPRIPFDGLYYPHPPDLLPLRH